MIPVVTPAQMTAIDKAAPQPLEELIDRAARAVARCAIRMLGGTYGRRVVVLAGPGNNGADGLIAATHLRRRGVHCEVVDAATAPVELPTADLIIDAAYGTGLSRSFNSPRVAGEPLVLAVDIPSGVDGLTGACLGSPLPADHTLTFVALKPGLLFEPGRSLAGDVEIADIGLDPGPVSVAAISDLDAASLLVDRPADDHKWRRGVRIVGGEPGMTGAAHLAARAAQRTGAGMVQISMPGAGVNQGPLEAVALPVPPHNWGEDAFADLDERVRAVLVGPGVGPVDVEVLRAAIVIGRPLVLDGGALHRDLVPLLVDRSAPTVLTPHDGEWARLGGAGDADRVGATQAFATEHQVTVVRKGPTTIVATGDGRARVITSGSAALATAGTGDVLAGAVSGLIAEGLEPFDAAVVGAHVHGRAGCELGPGLVAGEVADEMARVMAALREDGA